MSDVPSELLCPLSGQIMSDPVVWMDGNTYERRAIERWLAKHRIAFAASEVAYRNILFPNRAMKHAIETHLSEQSAKRGLKRKSSCDESAKVPNHFICPLSGRIMVNPVDCADGVTYERSEIERWLVVCDASPKTGKKLANQTLTANNRLKAELSKFSWEDYVRKNHLPSFQIFVKAPCGQTFALDVNKSSLVFDIQFELYKRGKAPLVLQQLSYEGRRMANDAKLSDYDVERGSTLTFAGGRTTGQIRIKTIEGKTRTVEIGVHETVEALRDLIHDMEGTPPDQQRLLCGGKQLEDGRTLEDYKIKYGDTVHVILHLRGC